MTAIAKKASIAGKAGSRKSRLKPGGALSGIKHEQGFTLLEVMVALTITGMALGGIFSVIAGNKQLAWRSQAALVETTQARNLIGYSQLNDERGRVFVDFSNQDLELLDDVEMEVPFRKTQPMRHALREYGILDANGEVVAVGSYWVELELPR